MRKHILLRILCGLTFLIFLCPFYQACSDESMESSWLLKTDDQQYTDTVEVITVKDTVTQKNEVKIIERKDTIYTKIPMPPEYRENASVALKRKRDEITFNVYDFNLVTLSEGFNYIILPYNLILLFAALQLIMAFNNRFNSVFNLALFSCIITIFYGLSLVTFLIQDITQIKYGYYLFIINTIAITLLSKKLTDDGI